MKKKATLLLVSAASVLSLNAQILFQENFTNPFNPLTAGWGVSNLSSPVGTTGWFQGNPNSFSAYNGAPSDYFAANFNNVATSGGISNWLVTPVLNIFNGAVIEFATRTSFQGAGQPNFKPDRLQLRMSTVSSSVIPTGTTNVGNFTTLLLDINPNLNTSTVSAVSNGSVNGYPPAWTVYSVQITGITGTVTGRFAFRYFVDAAGSATTTNANYIGLDAVKYTSPCGPTVTSYTTCSGSSATLTALGALPATTYSWDTGATTSSIVVAPVATTIYTLYPSNGTVSCGNAVTATVTIGSNMSMNVSASSTSVCAGRTVALVADGPAVTYSWSNGATTPVTTVTVNTTTTYSVGGANANLSCFGGNAITITALANPTLSASPAPSLSCPGTSVSVTGSGASSYIWVSGTQATTANPVTINTSTNPAGGTFTLGLIGTGINGCSSSGVLTLTISPSPTVNANVTGSQCINKTVTLTATGANSYAWTGSTVSSSATITYSNGSAAGVKSFTVSGTNTAGCTATTSLNYTVSACVGIAKINGNSIEASVFPNPFSSVLNLSGIIGYVEIYNAFGQLVIRVATVDNDKINTSALESGAYILKAYTEDAEVRTIRLLKN